MTVSTISTLVKSENIQRWEKEHGLAIENASLEAFLGGSNIMQDLIQRLKEEHVCSVAERVRERRLLHRFCSLSCHSLYLANMFLYREGSIAASRISKASVASMASAAEGIKGVPNRALNRFKEKFKR